MRDTSSSCRTASSNWVAGKTVGIAGNMSPEEIFGEGEDLVPMPLEESVFSSEAGEQFKLGDTPIANEVGGDATATVTGGVEGERGVASLSVPSIVESKIAAVAPKTTTAACATSGPSKGKDINSLTKYRKRMAEYLEESASILVMLMNSSRGAIMPQNTTIMNSLQGPVRSQPIGMSYLVEED